MSRHPALAHAHARFQRSSYSGIDAVPFDPLSAARPVAPPFAPGAFMRPAPSPTLVTHIPAGLAGPIYPAPGWHFGPPVHMAVRSGYNTSKVDWTKTQYAGDDKSGSGISLGVGVALAVAILGLPIASSVAFGRKYGGPGYVLGFFVPGALAAGIAAVSRIGKKDEAAAAK